LGHPVKLINGKFVKPFVKGNKTDEKDAEAISEAASRPNMRFVPVKTVEQQDIQNIHRVRSGLVRNRTSLVNQIRGLLSEYGIVMARQVHNLRSKLPEILEDGENELSQMARELFANLYEQLIYLDKKILEYEKQIGNICQGNEACQRLKEIPGFGVLTSTAFVASIGDPKTFKNGRGVSAWLGLVPREHSSGGKRCLLGISKRGNTYLRKLLIQGSHTVAMNCAKKTDKQSR